MERGPNRAPLSRFLNGFRLSGCRAALRGHRLVWLAVGPFYLLAMLLHLTWVCVWMPDSETDVDADGLAWESAAITAPQLDAGRADHLLASAKPSMN